MLYQQCLSTIAPTASLFTQSAFSATAPVSNDGTSDEKSFADCLKETHDDSDKDSQTADAPRPQSSPKRAAENHRESPRKASDATPLSLTSAVSQQQILDPRSLMLSLQKPAGGKGSKDSVSAAAAQPASLTNTSASAAAPKGSLAFGVSIPKQTGNASTVGQPANANVNAAQDAQGRAGSQGNSSKNSKDDDASPDASGAMAALKDTTQAAAATAIPAHSVTPAAQAVPVAYAHQQSLTASVTSVNAASATTAAAPIADPPATPSLRSQSIDLQVPGAGGDSVDVRVSQRAGDVQVTVRTPDNDLAQSLRQHLPELSDRLSQTGTDSQIWHPTASAETNNGGTQDEPGSNWQGQQQNSQGQQQQAQTDPDAEQNGRGSRWVEDFYNAEQEAL